MRNFSLWNHRKRKQSEKAVDTDNPQAENPQTDPAGVLPEDAPVDLEVRLSAEREQFAAVPRTADRHSDVLPAVQHVRHRRTGLRRRHEDGAGVLARRLVVGAEQAVL